MERAQTESYNNHKLATVFHDAGKKKVVIFCHGYRGTSIGPNRFFVRTARTLTKLGISSVRFDQYCSGNSEGDFIDSSFNDWIATTKLIAQDYLKKGYQVTLLGQSMGGAVAIVVGSEISEIAGVVAWAPDPNIEPFHAPESGIIEEVGQVVQVSFWQEAHDAQIAEKFPLIKAPTYVVQCTADEYVDKENRNALSSRAKPHQKIEIFKGYSHSSWSYKQSEEIITRSVNFLVQSFKNAQ